MTVPGRRAAPVLVPVIGLVAGLTAGACGSCTTTATPPQVRSCTVQGLSADAGRCKCRKTG
jgi:hypothetical protein